MAGIMEKQTTATEGNRRKNGIQQMGGNLTMNGTAEPEEERGCNLPSPVFIILLVELVAAVPSASGRALFLLISENGE